MAGREEAATLGGGCFFSLWHSPEQREIAARTIRELDAQRLWDAPIATELAPLEACYPTESSHQDYLRRNPAQPYCRVVVAPRLAAFRRRFAAR
jgi:peptide-methionine (S)-S-oxide reductase